MLAHAVRRDAVVYVHVDADVLGRTTARARGEATGEFDDDEGGGGVCDAEEGVGLGDVVVGGEAEDEFGVGGASFGAVCGEGVEGVEDGG